jgi:hypothetical protein
VSGPKVSRFGLYETTGFDAPVVGYRRYLAPAAD